MQITQHSRLIPMSIIFCIGTFLVPSVYAGGTDEDVQSMQQALVKELSLQDTEYAVTLGVIVSEENSTLLGSYVRIINDLIHDIPVRYLSSDERMAMQQQQFSDKYDKLQVELNTKRIELERAHWSKGDDKRVKKVTPANEDTQVQDIQKRISILEGIAPESIVVAKQMPLKILEQEYLQQTELYNPAVITKALDVDMLLYMDVERLGELQLVVLWAYEKARKRVSEVFRIITEVENIPREIEANARRIIDILSVERLSQIQFTVMSADGVYEEEARIRLNGDLIGVGTTTERFLPSDTYTVSAEMVDGRQVQQEITLGMGELKEHVLILPADDPEYTIISSTPDGASVYEESVFRGKTPLIIRKPKRSVQYTLVKDGYYESRITINAESPPIVRKALLSTDMNWEDEVDQARKRFYRAFGFFAVSVVAPLLINGIYTNTVQAYQDMNERYGNQAAFNTLTLAEQQNFLQQQQQLRNQSNIAVYSYYGSIALSVGLFTNMVIRLSRYINTAEGYHRR